MGPVAEGERSSDLERAWWRRPPLARVVVVVMVVALVGAAVVRRDGGEDDPPAPLALAGYTPATTEEVERQVGEDLPAGEPYVPVVSRFVAAGELPTLGGEAPAYRVTGDAGRAEFDELAELFGVEGSVDDFNGAWFLDTSDEILSLDRPGTWSYARLPPDDAPVVGPERTLGEAGTAGAGLPEPLDDGDEAAPLDGLPSDDAARGIALDLLETTGVDLDGA